MSIDFGICPGFSGAFFCSDSGMTHRERYKKAEETGQRHSQKHQSPISSASIFSGGRVIRSPLRGPRHLAEMPDAVLISNIRESAGTPHTTPG